MQNRSARKKIRSSTTIAEVCRIVGISCSTYYYWKKAVSNKRVDAMRFPQSSVVKYSDLNRLIGVIPFEKKFQWILKNDKLMQANEKYLVQAAYKDRLSRMAAECPMELLLMTVVVV